MLLLPRPSRGNLREAGLGHDLVRELFCSRTLGGIGHVLCSVLSCAPPYSMTLLLPNPFGPPALMGGPVLLAALLHSLCLGVIFTQASRYTERSIAYDTRGMRALVTAVVFFSTWAASFRKS
jgi:hypothetical protein